MNPLRAFAVNSTGELLWMVKGCVSNLRMAGIQTKQCFPGLAPSGAFFKTILVPPSGRA